MAYRDISGECHSCLVAQHDAQDPVEREGVQFAQDLDLADVAAGKSLSRHGEAKCTVHQVRDGQRYDVERRGMLLEFLVGAQCVERDDVKDGADAREDDGHDEAGEDGVIGQVGGPGVDSRAGRHVCQLITIDI